MNTNHMTVKQAAERIKQNPVLEELKTLSWAGYVDDGLDLRSEILKFTNDYDACFAHRDTLYKLVSEIQYSNIGDKIDKPGAVDLIVFLLKILDIAANIHLKKTVKNLEEIIGKSACH